MAIDKDMKAFGFLLLGLFFIMLITAVVFIGQDALNEVICEQASTTYIWNQSACREAALQNETVSILAITAILSISALVLLALGLLAIIVLVLLFKVIIRVASEFGKGKF